MQPFREPRPTSPARAAAAHANGARSRGPITPQGKSNSSRNSLRHGLRARTPLFTDPESAAARAATIEAFYRRFEPRSPLERRLVENLAIARWRRACLRNLEISTAWQPTTQSPKDRTFFLAAIGRLESQYRVARAALSESAALTYGRAFPNDASALADPSQEDCARRSPEVIEKTATATGKVGTPTQDPHPQPAATAASI